MESNQSNDSQVKVHVSKGQITVDHVKSGQYTKPGFQQAQLRQVITTVTEYPSQRVGNSLADSLFDVDEFAGIEKNVFTNTETRIAWMDVPEGTTVEQVTERLKKAPNATIYKILSHRPILTAEQKYSVIAGIRTLDNYAFSQAIRYGENAEVNGVDVSNQLILDTKHGNAVQYRANFFSSNGADDIDERGLVEKYVSPELRAELEGAGVISGQRI